MTLPRKLLAEGLATFFLFCGVIGSGIMAQTLSAGNDGVALLANSLATGAILYVLITVFGPLCGAQMNPAVSLAMALARRISRGEAAALIAAQLVGGLVAVVITHAMFDLPLIQFSAHQRTGGAQWLAEAVATFGLLLAIFGSQRYRPDGTPAVVAMYITAAYWFTASTSFANPAITLARSLTDTFAGIAPADAPAFILAQLGGAVAATWLAAYLFAGEPESITSPAA